jgi:hypothetical protein
MLFQSSQRHGKLRAIMPQAIPLILSILITKSLHLVQRSPPPSKYSQNDLLAFLWSLTLFK